MHSETMNTVLSKKCMCWCFIHYWIEKCTVKQWGGKKKEYKMFWTKW